MVKAWTCLAEKSDVTAIPKSVSGKSFLGKAFMTSPYQPNLRRKAAKPNKAQPSREIVEPPSGTLGPGTGPIWSVKFWFGNPDPHVHS